MTEDNKYTVSDPIYWFTGKGPLNKIGFTDEEIIKALRDSDTSISDLTSVQGFVGYCWHNKHELVKENVKVKVTKWKGEYSKEVYERGSEYRIINQYQGLRHGKIIFHLLKNKFDWFDSFVEIVNEKEKLDLRNMSLEEIFKVITEDQKKLTLKKIYALNIDVDTTSSKSLWNIYEVRNDDTEIYLKTKLGSLYVPLKVFIDLDFSIIENRMKEYALWYHDPKELKGYALNHQGRTKEQYAIDKQKDYEKMIAPLVSPEAEFLKIKLQKEKNKKDGK